MGKSVFSKRMERVMREKGVSRTELKDMVGISLQSIGNYLNDKRKPDYEIVSRLAKALGVSADYLLGLSEVPIREDGKDERSEEKKERYNSPFATNLRELIARNGTTRTALSKALGISRQAVSQYADGTGQPNVNKLVMIADYFGVSVEYLVGLKKSVVCSETKQGVQDYSWEKKFSAIVRYFGGEVSGFTVRADSASEAWTKLASSVDLYHVQAVELAEIVAEEREIK